jgi:formylglycine-generating enzyme required for sulfatase activity
MKSVLPAIVVLLAAMIGFGVTVLMPTESTSSPPVANAKDESQAQNESVANSATTASASAPQTMCNALGTPIPVVSSTSALHNREVVQKLKSRLPAKASSKLIVEAPAAAPEGKSNEQMVWIPGGVTIMGSDTGIPDEEPPHPVALDGFWMDPTEVTNRQFQEFVEATDYVTLAEKKPELRSIQQGSGLEDVTILDEFNQPGSICSRPLKSRADIDQQLGAYSWWQYVPGANWKHPEGPGSDISDRMDHPVVHVSWIDAMEYCKWRGATLPTEAQWEYAARGGSDGNFYPWGNLQNPNGEWKQNIWQGTFPITDTGADGFTTTAPVKSFESNGYGLYDMSGNVWEWCADFYQPDYYAVSPPRNPPGPDSSFDPQEPGIIKRVQRGGSFMCSDQYCIGYRVSARMKGEEDTGAFHTGFRCVVNVAQPQNN